MEELKEFADFRNEDPLNEANLPEGFFEVLNDFKLSPGGGWSMSFKKGNLLKVGVFGLLSWIPITKTWKNRRPPISSHDKLDINRFSGSDGMHQMFIKNTKSISKSKANSIMNSSLPEKLFKDPRSAIKFLEGLSPRTKVKITL
jgi:hypothetical protein